jgi:hypothetical protein
MLEVKTFVFIPTAIPEWHPEWAQVFPASPGEPVCPLGAPLEFVCPLLKIAPTNIVMSAIAKVRLSIFFLIVIFNKFLRIMLKYNAEFLKLCFQINLTNTILLNKKSALVSQDAFLKYLQTLTYEHMNSRAHEQMN